MEDGTRLKVSMTVVGVGVQPITKFLCNSGVKLDEENGGVLTDEYC